MPLITLFIYLASLLPEWEGSTLRAPSTTFRGSQARSRRVPPRVLQQENATARQRTSGAPPLAGAETQQHVQTRRRPTTKRLPQTTTNRLRKTTHQVHNLGLR